MPTGDFPPFPYSPAIFYDSDMKLGRYTFTPDSLAPPGCICPPGANKDCEAPLCPRRGIKIS